MSNRQQRPLAASTPQDFRSQEGSAGSAAASSIPRSGRVVGAVMVVGGGIGGIQTSLDLAESGFKVYLVESSPSIGGVMSQLDKTFPTNDCAMCIVSPKLVECGRHLNIDIMTCAEIAQVSGEAGNFSVQVDQRARYIDVDRCTGCAVCARSCPVSAVDTFNQGLSQRTAAYIRYPQAVPLAYAIDQEKCIGCGLCANLCLADAVRYDDQPRRVQLDVGAIVLAPGFEPFDARLRGEYGYGRLPNVVTSLEFERILSASGPYKGRVQRPSDGEMPSRIAFINCVGSRDAAHGRGYCSSVCCMYSTKQAVIAKEHAPASAPIEPTIFYIDKRAYGKDFDKYVERADREYNIRYVRHMVSLIREDPQTNNLLLRYEGTDAQTGNSTMVEEEFDLVVLAVGLQPPSSNKALAERLGIELNEYGFCWTAPLLPLSTSRPGVFTCGAFSAPKDVPETVMQASGAAGMAGRLLASARGTRVKAKEYPPERDIRGEPPRIGIFVCSCGLNIGGVVNVPEVAEYAYSLPGVAYAEWNLYTCSQDTQERIVEQIQEHNLNRVIVASCSPRTHEPLFRESLREAGLNRYLFEMANIRDQCSWVHMHEPASATDKAKDLVRMAAAKARGLGPLPRYPQKVIPRGLVVGGGIAGMTAALALAETGFECYLIEREAELGGILRQIYYTLHTEGVQQYLEELVHRVKAHPLIHVFTQATIESVAGNVGSFQTTLVSGNGHKEQTVLEHGVVIVATGGEENKPNSYLYGQHPNVITQLDLESRLEVKGWKPASTDQVVMIQCVESRDPDRPYCSRICCGEAIKNALRIKQANPNTNVFVLYRDIRTYGFKEDAYRKAREQGVIFIPYELESKPEVIQTTATSAGGPTLQVRVTDPVMGEDIVIDANWLVLSVAVSPPASNSVLAQMLKVPLNDDGFFLEAHAKLRPVDFATEGVFLCGLAHAPKYMEEHITQANAAAARACTVLTQEIIEAEGTIPRVDIARCVACGLCELVCAYKAISVQVVDQRRGTMAAQVNEALCKGCGACAAGCRSGAVDVQGFTDAQIVAAIEAL
jgi:heterodisulfide reductase subunit A